MEATSPEKRTGRTFQTAGAGSMCKVLSRVRRGRTACFHLREIWKELEEEHTTWRRKTEPGRPGATALAGVSEAARHSGESTELGHTRLGRAMAAVCELRRLQGNWTSSSRSPRR